MKIQGVPDNETTIGKSDITRDTIKRDLPYFYVIVRKTKPTFLPPPFPNMAANFKTAIPTYCVVFWIEYRFFKYFL